MKAETQDVPRTIVSPSRHPPLSLCRKLCYGFGGVPVPLTQTIIAFYISVFLLEYAKLQPFYASVVIFSGRAWDAVTDPIIGYYMNKFDTKFGKLKPWIILSMPFGVICYFLLWSIPETTSEGSKFAYYLIVYCSFSTFLTCYNVPHAALTMYITHAQNERDSATAYRIWCDIAGVVVGMVIQVSIVSATMGSVKSDPCISMVNANDTPPWAADMIDLQENGFQKAASVLCVIYCTCALVIAFGVREYKDVAVTAQEQNDPFFESLKTVLSYRPYSTLLLTFMSFNLATQIIQGNLVLYCKYALKLDSFETTIVILLISALVSLPLWQTFLNKYGKRKALAVGMFIFAPLVASLLFIPGWKFVIYCVSFVSGVCVAASSLLPWSMIPDVIDDFTVQTGTRKEAIFYSFYVFFNKFASGVALGLSTLTLGFAGYKTGSCEQPSSVGLALRIFASVGPLLLMILGFKFLKEYPITEERRRTNSRALEKLREKQLDFIEGERFLMSSSTA
ncbi:sodium-dependent lysophosphatidylcholine symporter 1-B-like [Ptychodera flava]|uniref:sodium-dependent lysophosphatidylcholine symporter 1-B-like n=1 Tax=Ptychodera flava TaxID=63121 RepID=UPI00396A7A91